MTGTHTRSDSLGIWLALVSFVGIVVVAGVIANLLLGYLTRIDSSATFEGYHAALGILMPVLALLGFGVFAYWWVR